MSAEALEKINGQSLNAMNEFLNPVNNETMDKTFRAANEVQYTALETKLVRSRYVATATRRPIKIRATPSVIHSIVIMRLLSNEMSPKPRTTFRVGNRCAIPQPNSRNEPIYVRTAPFMIGSSWQTSLRHFA